MNQEAIISDGVLSKKRHLGHRNSMIENAMDINMMKTEGWSLMRIPLKMLG